MAKGRGACLVVLTAWAATAGCRQPSMGAPGTVAVTMPKSTCAVFVAQYSEQIGGQPAVSEVIYAAADGTVQQTREDTDDIVYSWRQGTAETATLLDSLSELVLALPTPEPSQGPEQQDDGGLMLPEYTAPLLFVELSGCPATLPQWEGDAAAAPPALAGLLQQASALVDGLPEASGPPGQRFVRAQELGADQVELLRRAGLVVEISDKQLAGCPLLEQALATLRRLIVVPAGENLYGELPLTFAHQKSAHVALGERVFQIRHLLAKEQAP